MEYFRKMRSRSTPRPDSYRSPGYPTFIALLMWGAGEQNYLKWLIYAQAIMGALLVPIIFLTGLFFLPVAGAMVSALLTAFSPHLITTTGCVLSETLFGFLLAGGCLLPPICLRETYRMVLCRFSHSFRLRLSDQRSVSFCAVPFSCRWFYFTRN